MSKLSALLLFALVFSLTPGCLPSLKKAPSAELSTTLTQGTDLTAQFRELLHARCASCHVGGGSAAGSPMDLSTPIEHMVTAGYLVPGAPDQSRLIQRMKGANLGILPEDMPTTSGPLASEEIALFRRAIAEMAPIGPPRLEWMRPSLPERVSRVLQIEFELLCSAGANVEISGERVAALSSTCTSSGTLSGVLTLSPPGAYLTQVKARQVFGGQTLEQSIDLNIDTVAPIVTTSIAANQAFPAQAVITGACSAGDLDVRVQVQGEQAFTGPCSGVGQYSIPITLGAPDGPKTLHIEQSDAHQNVSAPLSVQIRRITQLPQVTITAPASGLRTRVTSHTLQGACDQQSVTITSTKIQGSPRVGACMSGAYSIPVIFLGPDGPIDVRAESIGPSGLVGFATASYVLDTTAPVLSIQSPAQSTALTSTNVNVDLICEAGLSVQVGGDRTAPSSVNCPTSGRTQFTVTLSSGAGVKNLSFSQTDAAQNSGQATLQLHYAPPVGQVLQILSPLTGASFNSPQIPVQVRCSTLAGVGPVQLSGARVTSQSHPCPSSGTLSVTVTVQSGQYTSAELRADQLIQGANQSHSILFNLDTQPPTLTMSAPTEGQRVQRTLTAQGTCSENGRAVTLSGDLSTTVHAVCTSGAYASSVSLSGSEGTKVIQAQHLDAAGNPAPAIQRNVILDLTAPALAVSAPTSGAFINTTALTVSGTCESGSTVHLSGTFSPSPTTATCVSGSFSKAVTLNTPDGPKQLTAHAVDAAQNASVPIQVPFTLDRVSLLSILTPTNGIATNQATLTLSGVCEGSTSVAISGDLTAPTTAPCANSAYSKAVTLAGADGLKTIQVSQTDPAGNVGNRSVSLTLDRTITLEIASPAENAEVLPPDLMISGTCEPGAQLLFATFGQNSQMPCPTSGTYSKTVGIGALLFGYYQFTVSSNDGAGNMRSLQRRIFRLPNSPMTAFGKAQRVLGLYCTGCHTYDHSAWRTWSEAQFIANNVVVAGNANASVLTQRTKHGPGPNANMPADPTLYAAFTQANYDDLKNWIQGLSSGGGGSGGGGSAGTLALTEGESPVLMDRFALKSKLSEIFGITVGSAYSSGDMNPADRIEQLVTIFGGPCDQANIHFGEEPGFSLKAQVVGEGACGWQESFPSKGGMVDNFDKAAATSPRSFAQREGFRIKACWDIAYKDYTPTETAMNSYLRAAISHTTGVASANVAAYVNASPVPTDSDIRKAYELFYPQGDLPSVGLEKLRAVASQAVTRFGGTRKWEGWRYLLVTLCLSPEWQAQ